VNAPEPGVGELINVTIRGARIESIDTGLAVCSLPGHAWRPTVNLRAAGVDVTRVAPKEWPPRPGDVWEGADGAQFFARAGEPGDPGWLAPADREIGSSYPDEILASFGPLRLVYRRGWSPKPAPAAGVDEPEAETLDERAAAIAGLRELADWLDEHPQIPLDSTFTRFVLWPDHWHRKVGDDEAAKAAGLADLLRLAEHIGADVRSSTHVYAGPKRFRGGVELELIVCEAADLYRAQLAAQAEDLTRGGEVAAPVEGPGAATAPSNEDDAGTQQPEQVAPGVGEQVWTARVRQGLVYHRVGAGQYGYTACRRPTGNGTLIGVAEAVALAGTACERCYPDGHDIPDGAS
jgi:hypothetical protein